VTDAGLTRRGFLGAGLALGAGVAFDPVLRHLPNLSALPGLAPQRGTPGTLAAIDHVVLMMQENRSFDLTSAFNFAAVDPSIPDMPKPRTLKDPGVVCSPVLAKYPKTHDGPEQAAGTAKRPSGLPT